MLPIMELHKLALIRFLMHSRLNPKCDVVLQIVFAEKTLQICYFLITSLSLNSPLILRIFRI
jgi:hypothetical protein